MLRRFVGAAVVALCVGCPPGGDLTVPPPPKVPAGFKVDIPPPRDDGRLPAHVVPLSYELDFEIDPHAEQFSGQARLEVNLKRATSALILHGAELDVNRAEVLVGERRVSVEASYRKAAGAKERAEELVLVTTSELPPGRAVLQLDYTAPLTAALRGIYRVQDEDASYVFTQLEPSDARRVFPSFDDPAYKVPFTVSVTVPAGNEVFTNTPEVERTTLDDGRVRRRFAASPPMPTYLLALAVGPLEVLEGPTEPVPLRVVTAAGKAHLGKKALSVAAEQLALFSDYFGEPYPYAKLDLVAVPNFGPGAMENAGLITFREELLLVDRDDASAKASRDLAMIMGHELAHQWFGNLVTMQWWDDLWLNEGFATYMETWVVDQQSPELRADLELLSLIGWVMDFDALPSARRVRQPVSNTYEAEEAFDGITYVKGASVIRMLEQWLGEDAFQEGIRRYLAKHRLGNASADDLFAALAETSQRDVRAVASSFLDQPGVPLVTARLSCGSERPTITLAQKRYQGRPSGDDGSAIWSIPVCVEYTSSLQVKETKRACTLLRDPEATLTLEEDARCPRYILPNADYAGYYRYALEGEALDSLLDAALAGDPSDKVGFLSNAWALVQAGEVPAVTLLEVLGRFDRERERAVIEQLVEVLDDVSSSLIEDAARPQFRKLVATLLLPTAKRLGWRGRPNESDDDRLLRREVLEALAVLTDDPWMASQAKRQADAWLSAPDSVDDDVATVALRLAAHRGDLSFETLKATLDEPLTPRQRIAVVQALGSLGSERGLKQTLRLVSDGTIRAQDALYVARTAVEWPSSRRVFRRWLEDHLDPLAAKIPGFGLTRMVATLRRVCEPEARKHVEKAFMPLMPKIGGERRLREALETADLCIDLRGRQARLVSEYLEKQRRL